MASSKGGMEQERAPSKSDGLSLHVATYMAVFFLAMIGHELALEAASTEFSNVDSLSSAVTAFQFGFCVLLPLLVSRGRALTKFPRSPKECAPYIRLSLVVFGATALATESLRYVTYPVKVVFKSAKLIPTMIVATIMQGKGYGTMEYTAAALLCAGAAGYSYGSGAGGPTHTTSLPGLLLLLISILCDAVVPNLQQSLMASKSSTLPQTNVHSVGLTAEELMVNVNAVGFIGLLVSMAVSGHLLQVIGTCMTHPRLLVYLVMVGVGLSTAVLAYTRLIQESGSVVAVGVATLRKVATVILSYLLFPKPLLGIHIGSGFLVLGGMILSSVAKQRSSQKP